MASNSSGPLKERDTYTLGKYVFSIVVTRLPEENITAITANVVCEGKRAVKGKDFPMDTQVENWSVEASDDTADVYATVKSLNPEALFRACYPLAPGASVFMRSAIPTEPSNYRFSVYNPSNVTQYLFVLSQGGKYCVGVFSTNSGPVHMINDTTGKLYPHTLSKDSSIGCYQYMDSPISEPNRSIYNTSFPTFTWAQVRTLAKSGSEQHLLGRFEIDLETAGGGPEGDWDEPGDTGDPSYTLNLTVTGASSGTHDSDSFPSDNETTKDYGCGGDGGHGGGGGAGASTVIIYEFATSRAGSVNQETYTREPGVGSGGGKGGKGGDGCILIYY